MNACLLIEERKLKAHIYLPVYNANVTKYSVLDNILHFSITMGVLFNLFHYQILTV